jgi:hypothetical protein
MIHVGLRSVSKEELAWNVLVGFTIVGTIFKLSDLIDWPWWIVLAPFLLPFSLIWVVFVCLVVYWLGVLLMERIRGSDEL